MRRPRTAVLALLLVSFLTACSSSSPQPSASASTGSTDATALSTTAVPTTAPASPTPEPIFSTGSQIAGIDVGGLTLVAAAEKLRTNLAAPPPALEIQAGDATLSLDPTTIGLAVSVDQLIEQAGADLRSSSPVDIPLAVSLDEDALRSQLEDLAARAAIPAAVSVISSTKTISRTFAYTPGHILDIDAAMSAVIEELSAAEPETSLKLKLVEDPQAPTVSLDRLRDEVEALAEEVPGVVGFHLTDLATDTSIGFNDKTVFAGASTIKVAIMLNAYVNLAKFSEKQTFWLNEMIRYSDNISANHLLAAAAGGNGTDLAFVGADQMSTMLQEDLGLRHTYLYVPFETTDYIKLYKPKYKCGPKGNVGEKPYTEMGACLRAEPASMASLYQMIDQCANDEGVLLEKFDLLTPKRCQEMLDWLSKNGDKTRMVAGIPKGVRVEHKSGWIEDLNADAGIVRSPNGDYVLAIYYYRPLGGRAMWEDKDLAPVVAAFSQLAYTAYNPVKQK